jgi:hypothetical protein
MQKGRLYLRVLLLAGAMVLGVNTLGLSQEATAASVNARADTISIDIDNRIAATQNTDAKACLRNKKTAVGNIKSSAGSATEFGSLIAQLNAIAGELDSCTAGPGGGPAAGAGTAPPTTPTPTTVSQTVDPNAPDPNAENPGVILAPGHEASGPGVIDEGSGGGPDFGGGDVGEDDTQQPPVIPPPISPTM